MPGRTNDVRQWVQRSASAVPIGRGDVRTRQRSGRTAQRTTFNLIWEFGIYPALKALKPCSVRSFNSKAASAIKGNVLMNNRSNERHQVRKAGTISFRSSSIDCTIHNISIGGANLEVESHIGIPDSFHLTINAENGRQHCHVVWRNERRIGVAFEAVSFDRRAAPPARQALC
jgi:PilZ domain